MKLVFKKFVAVLTLSLAMFTVTATAALAKHETYHVKSISYKTVLAYDASATKACLHGHYTAKPTSRVVFMADGGKSFNWSPSEPNIYYENFGWSNCKGYRRIS